MAGQQLSGVPTCCVQATARLVSLPSFSGESFMAIGMKDPVLGPPAMQALRETIRGCPAPMQVAEGGHFVQEWGAPIARAALAHFKLG